MTVTQSLYKRVGAVNFPPGASDSLDPGRDILIALLAAAINTELADRFTAAALGSVLGSNNPVQTQLTVGPERQINRMPASGWPLLAVYRDWEIPQRWEQATLEKWRLTSTWGIDYVLGPYQDDQDSKRDDVLTAVIAIVCLTLEAGKHPAYNSGNPCLGPWLDTTGASTCAGFSTVRLTNLQRGQARFSDEDSAPRYHAASISLETTERDYHRAHSGQAANGATYTFGIGDGVQVLPDAVVIRTGQ